MLKPKEERFARAMAAGSATQSAAYAEAYDIAKLSPEAIADRASRLANKPDVVERIKVLTEGATRAALKVAAYTLDKAIDEADKVLDLARGLGQTAAAVAAIKLKAQLAGHVLDRKEIKEIDPLKGATTEELAKLRDEITRRILAAKDTEQLTAPHMQKVA